jgi:hypothetical protein
MPTAERKPPRVSPGTWENGDRTVDTMPGTSDEGCLAEAAIALGHKRHQTRPNQIGS